MKKVMFVLTLGLGLSIASVNTINAQTVVKEKNGWSGKAKGAVIGAGAGALTGAAVSHDKSKGAIIGGVVGAGAGYAIGAHHDKTHPRKRIYKKTVK